MHTNDIVTYQGCAIFIVKPSLNYTLDLNLVLDFVLFLITLVFAHISPKRLSPETASIITSTGKIIRGIDRLQ